MIDTSALIDAVERGESLLAEFEDKDDKSLDAKAVEATAAAKAALQPTVAKDAADPQAP